MLPKQVRVAQVVRAEDDEFGELDFSRRRPQSQADIALMTGTIHRSSVATTVELNDPAKLASFATRVYRLTGEL